MARGALFHTSIQGSREIQNNPRPTLMDQMDKKLNVTIKRYVCINCMAYIHFRNYEEAPLYPGFLTFT